MLVTARALRRSSPRTRTLAVRSSVVGRCVQAAGRTTLAPHRSPGHTLSSNFWPQVDQLCGEMIVAAPTTPFCSWAIGEASLTQKPSVAMPTVAGVLAPAPSPKTSLLSSRLLPVHNSLPQFARCDASTMIRNRSKQKRSSEPSPLTSARRSHTLRLSTTSAMHEICALSCPKTPVVCFLSC